MGNKSRPLDKKTVHLKKNRFIDKKTGSSKKADPLKKVVYFLMSFLSIQASAKQTLALL